MRVIYITGGGKCGTHLVAQFLHANWPESTLHPTEFKTWIRDLPEHLTDRLIFHCPSRPIEPFRTMCPSGTVLTLVRNPVQQYISWLCTFAQGLLFPSKQLPDEMHKLAMHRVMYGFEAAGKSDSWWRIEDFASSQRQRFAMVDALLRGDSLSVDPPLTISKSRFGWGNGVHPITQTEYASILTDAEISAFEKREIRAAYPDWTDRLLLRGKSDEERLIARYQYILGEARKMLVQRFKDRGRLENVNLLRPIEEVAAKAVKNHVILTSSLIGLSSNLTEYDGVEPSKSWRNRWMVTIRLANVTTAIVKRIRKSAKKLRNLIMLPVSKSAKKLRKIMKSGSNKPKFLELLTTFIQVRGGISAINRVISLAIKESAGSSSHHLIEISLSYGFKSSNRFLISRYTRKLVTHMTETQGKSYKPERWAVLVSSVVRTNRDRALFTDKMKSSIKKKLNYKLRRGNQAIIEGFVRDATELLAGFVGIGWTECASNIEKIFSGSLSENPDVLALLGKKQKVLYNLHEARELLQRALSKPNYNPYVHFELAEVLEWLGDDESAISESKKGLDHFPEKEIFIKTPVLLNNFTGPLMRQGNLEAGWLAFTNRHDRYVLGEFSQREIWPGPSASCDTLIVFSEYGIGDELKFATCYRDLLACVPNLVVSTDRRLVKLMERTFPTITFVTLERNQAPKQWKKKALTSRVLQRNRIINLELSCLMTAFQFYALSGDLPQHFRKSRSNFPHNEEGYLVPDISRRTFWRSRLDRLGPGLKVGISWRSMRRGSLGQRRSQHYFTLEDLKPLLSINGAHFVNLQYDGYAQELALFEREHGIVVHSWSDLDVQNDLEGVAALMKELDLVIAPHNMVKELAGAVGTPVLFLVPSGQAWVRWRADPVTRKDIWHASLTHLHAEQVGDRQDVVQQAKDYLERAVAERRVMSDPDRIQSDLHIQSKETKSKATVRTDPVVDHLVNEFGEVFKPAGQAHFKSRSRWKAELRKRDICFEQVTAAMFKGLAQPAQPDGVFLILGQDNKQYALTVLAAHELLKRNWASVCLDKAPFNFGTSPNEDLDFFQGCLIKGSKPNLFHFGGGKLVFPWEIDLPQRICRVEGLNFYGTIFNQLGKEFRRYPSDFTDAEILGRFKILQRTCDAALAVCIEAEKRITSQGMQVRFTGYEQDCPPSGVFKIYCAERGYQHGIEFVEIAQSNEGTTLGLITSVDCQNVTRHGLSSARTLRRDKFDNWFKAEGKQAAVAERSRRLTMLNHLEPSTTTPQARIILDRIEKHKATGGKVACLYGCVPYDFGHPWVDNGPAHSDMGDWYNHTVRTLAETDTLLLVKPHPDEAHVERFGVPNQYFVEMLDIRPPSNVVILGHGWLDNNKLLPKLDLGIVWRSSAAVELALMGIPVVVCNPHSIAEKVLDLPTPKDRADYEDMLRNTKRILMKDKLRERASAIFKFYRTHVMIQYPFGWIPQNLKDAGGPVWSKAAIQHYLVNGHPSINEMCDRIIGP